MTACVFKSLFASLLNQMGVLSGLFLVLFLVFHLICSLPCLVTSGFPFYGVRHCLLLKDFGFADWRPLPQVDG